ncbi:PAAR domain-containing protein [Enterobacteriaceae bacterium ESL0689]|nr:PAAR domain-containing protein [Enterobacteriaceae bacterium ESL0689]
MGNRSNCYGRGTALDGDITITGARCIASMSNHSEHGRRVIHVEDKTTRCPKCGQEGVVMTGEPRHRNMGRIVAVDGSDIACGCPSGTNRIIAPAGQWIGSEPNPAEVKRIKLLAERKANAEEKVR